MRSKKTPEGASDGLLGASLMDATELSRRDLLAVSRRHIAKTIEGGVPPHTLARLITELTRIDSEIRFIDSAESDEVVTPTADEPWDESMI